MFTQQPSGVKLDKMEDKNDCGNCKWWRETGITGIWEGLCFLPDNKLDVGLGEIERPFSQRHDTCDSHEPKVIDMQPCKYHKPEGRTLAD